MAYTPLIKMHYVSKHSSQIVKVDVVHQPTPLRLQVCHSHTRPFYAVFVLGVEILLKTN